MPSPVDRVFAAVTDGRAQNPRFIQRQLLKLSDAILKKRPDIEKVLRKDHGYSAAETFVEFYLTFNAVRKEYTSVDVKAALDQEYSLAQSKDHEANKVAVGCVYIVPSTHSPFYSTVAPIAAALAAGNCVILERRKTLSEIHRVLKELLLTALDNDTIAIVESQSGDDSISQRCTLLNCIPRDHAITSSKQLLTPNFPAAAVVDRSADLAEAARELVRARFSFQGRSPYAPDLVLVNEFSLKAFCNAAVRLTIEFSTSIEEIPASGSGWKTQLDTNNVIGKDFVEDGSEILITSSRGKIVLVRDRESKLLGTKVLEPVLLIHPISSMDDAIDFLNKRSAEPLLAAYLFGEPSAAKYLSQFIRSSACFANCLPADLLIGPPTPNGFATVSQPRFNRSMFSTAKPEIINKSPITKAIAEVLDGDDAKIKQLIRNDIEKPLPPTKQPKGGAIGFFDQGLIVGASILLTSIVASGVLLKDYAYPAFLSIIG